MLARAGVGKLRLIDFDQVTLSSLNRHAVASREDVGLSKASVLKAKLHAIVPFIEIDARKALFEADAADLLLSGRPDFVLDCIDDVKTKCDLLIYCTTHGIPVLTSFGAGGKADPTRLHIGDYANVVRE